MSRTQSIDQALSVNVLQHLFKHKEPHVVFLLMHKELDLTKEQSKSCFPWFSNFTTGIQFESKVTPSSTIRLQRQMKRHNSLALDHFRHQTERLHLVSGASALMRRSKSSFTCISVRCNQKTYSGIFLTTAASICFLLAQRRPKRKQNKRELAVIIKQECEYLWSWNILQNLFVPLGSHFSTHRQSANAIHQEVQQFSKHTMGRTTWLPWKYSR